MKTLKIQPCSSVYAVAASLGYPWLCHGVASLKVLEHKGQEILLHKCGKETDGPYIWVGIDFYDRAYVLEPLEANKLSTII